MLTTTRKMRRRRTKMRIWKLWNLESRRNHAPSSWRWTLRPNSPFSLHLKSEHQQPHPRKLQYVNKINNNVYTLHKLLLQFLKESLNENGENVVRATDKIEDFEVQTEDISSRFKFFEQYQQNQPDKPKKVFRITPPRDGQVKVRKIFFIALSCKIFTCGKYETQTKMLCGVYFLVIVTILGGFP
jgi:hypothetical protein